MSRKHTGFTWLFVVVFCFIGVVTSFAQPSPAEVTQIEKQVGWVKDDTGWRYYRPDGTIAMGYFMDETGDIYVTKDENGYILTDSKDAKGQYFARDGKLTILGYRDFEIERNKERGSAYEKNTKIYFDNAEDLAGFFNYYLRDFTLNRQVEKYYYNIKNGKSYSAIIPDTYVYNRGTVEQLLTNEYGSPIGADTELGVLDEIIERLRPLNFKETDNVIMSSLSEALNAQEVVCWHLAKITKWVLSLNNIDAHIINGTKDGLSHSWVKLKVDGKWIYTDPTFALVSKFYTNIPEEYYLSHYITDTGFNT